MKKILILAIGFIFVSAMSFAQQSTARNAKAVAPVAIKIVDAKNFTGKVKAVTVADPVKGAKSEVTVIDDKSAEKTFLVKSTTTVYGADFKAITFDKLKVDEKIKVKYATTKEGVFEAISINILK